MAAVIVNSVDIARAPEDVFDYLADVRNEPHWNPDCEWAESASDGPIGVGSRFRAKWRQGPAIDTEITAFRRPQTWTYQNGGPISLVLEIVLEPTASGGTRLTSTGIWSANGPMKLIFPLFVRRMRSAERQVMANARRALEERRDIRAAS